MNAALMGEAAACAAAGKLPLAFKPIRINSLVLPNRILMGSIHLSLDSQEDAYERMAHFYALRAKGEVGLIVTAGCSPNEAGDTSAEGFRLDHDELIDSHRLITHAVHAEGGRIALQLLHFGREAFHGRLVSSSAKRLESNLFTPKALSEAEIWQTIDDFGTAARRAVQAGYDAIELIFSQGFLVHQFLSPHINQRRDAWGGSLENRMRFAIEVAKRVRAEVGPAFPLLYRIPFCDLLPDALQGDEAVALVHALKPYGIDLLNVSIGWHESDVPTIAMVVPRAAFSPVADRVKRLFPDLTVCVSNRINDMRTAEALLGSGVADMVSMARPFLADPSIVSKSRKGDYGSVNTCIACNQSCLDYVFLGEPVGCSVNPDCGSPVEGDLPRFDRAVQIAVLGGGLAGMCAALYLARRGARVTLFESAPRLGGQLNMASRIPGKSEFAETVRYYSEALFAHGVTVRCGVKVTEGVLQEQAWDHVIVATGSVAKDSAGLDVSADAHVLTYEDVLRDNVPARYPAVVVGGGGVACDVAKFLAKKRSAIKAEAAGYLTDAAKRLGGDGPVAEDLVMYAREANGPVPEGNSPQVTILQRSSKKLAFKLGRTTRWISMSELERQKVRAVRDLDILRVENDGVLIRHRRSGAEEKIPAATVVLAIGQSRGSQRLEEACARLGLPCSVIGAASEQGDSKGNISITWATSSAYRCAAELTL